MALTDEQRADALLACPDTLKFYDQGIASFKSTEEDILKKIEDFKIRAAAENEKAAKPVEPVEAPAEEHSGHHHHYGLHGKKEHSSS